MYHSSCEGNRGRMLYMEHVMEQYGGALLQIAGGAGMLMLFESMLRPQGALNQILQMYFNGICG
jgi:hypothetical protein